MSSTTLDPKVTKFQNMMSTTERLGVSDFARSKSWRERLPETGCFQVVDRTGVVGYLLAPDYAQALNDHIAQLEEQAERAQIAAMFAAREDRTDLKSGQELQQAALDYLDRHCDALEQAIHGD